jgi:glycosyltransferase 2 family protein
MKRHWQRWRWRIVKAALAVVILVAVGWQIAGDLRRLDISRLHWHPGWILASGGLYLVGLIPYAWFWGHLLDLFGYPIALYAGWRAHYISQLGKYVPGKALAIAIRADLAHPFGIPYGVSIIATFYEVFTGMAAGALVAALVFLVEPPETEAGLGWHPMWTGIALIGLCGIPLLPGVFNFVIGRLEARIQAIELYRLPPVRLKTLAIGLCATGAGWWVQGLSLWAMLQVLSDPPDLTFSWWALCTASIAFASVAGFAIAVIPGGLGVREAILTILLRSAGHGENILAAAILLRIVWIGAEILFALCTYWWKPAPLQTSNEVGQAFQSDNQAGKPDLR